MAGVDVLVIDALAVARLTRLVTVDTLTRPARAAVIRRAYGKEASEVSDLFAEEMVRNDHDAPKLAELITCGWCSSMYCGAFVVVARAVAPRLWDPLARVLAASLVTGIVQSHIE